MTSLFKVGDKVKTNLSKDNYNVCVTSEMIALNEKSFIIKEVFPHYHNPKKDNDDGMVYKLVGDPGNWSWTSSMLKRTNSPSFTLIISSNKVKLNFKL